MAGQPAGNGFLSTPSGGVIFLQFASTNPLSGTAVTAYVEDSPPNEQVQSQSVSVSGTLSGSSIALSFNNSTLQFGTVSGDSFTINFPQNDGSLAPVTFTRAPTSAYNSALAQLQAAVSEADGEAAAEQEQAAQDKKVDQDAQDVAGEIAYLSQDDTGIPSDVAAVTADVNEEAKDLAAAQTAAQQVASEANQSDSTQGTVCGDASAVAGDASGVAGDASGVEGAATGVEGDIGTINETVAGLKSDFSAFQADEADAAGYVPAGAPTQSAVDAALAAAQSAINTAVTTTNGDIAKANSDVTAAFTAASQAARAGNCGPAEATPTPEPPITATPDS